jgi:DNA topoisomerase-2
MQITENKKGEEYTRITFKPDLPRFGMDKIDDDTEALLMKRVYDMAGTVKDCKVFLNDERIKIKGFKQYIDMYLSASTKKQEEETGGGAVVKPVVVYEASKDGRWEIGFALSDGQMQQVSFANSISTIKGGTHVEAVAAQISTALMEQVKKKNKAAPIKPHQIKNHMWIFVNALVENPAFDSQTKETLTLKPSAFGSKLALSEDFIKKGKQPCTFSVSNPLLTMPRSADSRQDWNRGERLEFRQVQVGSDDEKVRRCQDIPYLWYRQAGRRQQCR